MFSGNSFGALAVDDSPEMAGPSRAVNEGEEVDVDWLKLVQTKHDVRVVVQDKIDLSGLPAESCLLALSNSKDLVMVGGNSDVRFHQLSEVHNLLETSTKDSSPASTPLQTLTLPARPVWVRLAANEEVLVVATIGAGIRLFKVADVLSGNTAPYTTITSGIPDILLDVLPNPAAPSPSDKLCNYVTLLAREGLVIIDIESGNVSSPQAGPFTCACWSAKGKQMIVGSPDGKLVQYTPEGEAKGAVLAPPELDNHYPAFVQWLENDLFFVGYAPAGGDPSDSLELFIIHRTKMQVTYTKFFDLNDNMGYSGRSGQFRHIANLKAWGDKTKHMSFMISPAASEIATLHGKPAADKTPPEWEALILDETARAVVPAGKPGVSDDTSPLGLALDLTSTKVIVRGIVAGEELPDLPPAPRLLVLSQEGFILSFDVRYEGAGSYPGMVAVGSAPAAQPASPAVPAPASQPAFGGGGFGSSGFGSSSTPAFGSTAFGQATPSKPAPFGQSTPSKPAAFGSTTPGASPAFGASAFGQSTTPKPAFGSSAFGQSSTPTSSPGFGQSSFGQSATASGSAFGSGAFGSSSSSGAAFGQTAFGAKPATPSAFGTSSTGSGFGAFSSKSSTGFAGFGQQAKVDDKKEDTKPASTGSAFGGSSFGGFGQKSDKPAFGGAVTEQKTDKPVFGSSASPSAFGSSSFGQPSTSTSAFGSSGFGQPSQPAFAGFGQKAAESKPAFAGFGQSAPKEDNAPKSSGDAFGLGGLDDSLNTKSVPGLADSPPASPTLAPGTVPGLEDDSPPPSPPRAEATPKSAPFERSSTAFSTAFIKPATAFGGEAKSTHGAFGSAAQKSPSPFGGFGTSKPAAFASTPTKPASPTSGSAFGQSSTPGGSPAPATSSTPAFGQSTAFGQSAFGSSAFGQPKPAATTTPIGNISGGFGGFASKPAADAEQKPAGFSAFAAKGEEKNVFGDSKPSAFSTASNGATKSAFGAPSGEGKSAFGSTAGTKSAFSFAGDAKSAFGGPGGETKSAFSFAPKEEEKKPAFSFKPAEKKEDATEEKKEEAKPASAFSYSGKSAFDFKPKDDKPAFSFSKPAEKVDDSGSASPGDPTTPAIESPSGSSKDSKEDDGLEVTSVQDEDEDDYEDDYEDEEEGDYEDEEEEEWEDDEGEEEEEGEEGDELQEEVVQAGTAEESEEHLETIPEDDETASEGEGDESTSPSTSPKRPKSPPWFASTPNPPSLLSRMGPPVNQTPESQPTPPRQVPAFALKHAPKTSSPLGAIVHTADEEEPRGSPSTSPSTSPRNSVGHLKPGGVGLGLASHPTAFGSRRSSSTERSDKSDKSDDGKDRSVSPISDKAEPKEVKAEVKTETKADDSKKTDKPAFSFKQPGLKEGEWECETCMLANPDSAQKCTVCDAPRPKPKTEAAKADTKAETPKPLFSFKQPELKDGEWECDTCMCKSPADAVKCTVCDEPRKGAAPSASTSKAAPSASTSKAAPPAPPSAPAAPFSFGGKPASTPAAPSAPVASTGASPFSFGGKPVGDAKAPAPTAFTGFGKPAAKSDDKEAPKPIFGGFGQPSDDKKDAPKPLFGGFGQPAKKGDRAAPEWKCDTCDLMSPDSADKCIVCDAARPGKASEKPASVAAPPAPPVAPAGGFSFGGKAFGSGENKEEMVAPAVPSQPFSGFGKPADKASPSPPTKPFAGFGQPAKTDDAKKDDKPTSPAPFGFAKPTASSTTTASPFAALNKPTAGMWKCNTCDCESPESADKCEVCEAAKPGAAPAQASKPAAMPVMPSAPAGGFGFGGKPAPASPAAGAKAPAPFSFATATKPTESMPAAPASFSLTKPSTATPPPAVPAGGFVGFGKQAPAVAPTSASPFGQQTAPQTASPVKGFSLSPPKSASGLGLGKPPAASSTAAPAATASPPATTTQSVQTFNPPERPVVPSTSATAASQAKSMGAMMENIVADVQDDLAKLKSSLKANATYHSAINSKGFARPSLSSINQHKALPFSVLEDVLALAHELSTQLAAVRDEVRESDVTLAELQSRMLKTDMKAGQAEKFLKARKDPSFARAMQIKELSPQQAADQMRLRKVVQMTEARLDELEAGIAGLKRRTASGSGRGTSQPALERIQRSVRNLDVAIRDRQQAVDDLTRRVGSLHLSRTRENTPARDVRESTPARETEILTRSVKSPGGTPQKNGQTRHAAAPETPPRAPSLDPTDAQRTAAAKALDGAARRRRAVSSIKTATLTRVDEATPSKSSLVSHASVARGPIMVDAVPVPGSGSGAGSRQGRSSNGTPSKHAGGGPIKAETEPSAPEARVPSPGGGHVEPLQVAAAGESSGGGGLSGLAGIKLNLDPGSLASATSGSSQNSRRTAPTRAHGSAVKLVNPVTVPAAGASAGGLFGSVPSPATGGGSRPTGFFSFSGFGSGST